MRFFRYLYPRTLNRLAVTLLCLGVLISGIALFSKSHLTPVGTMDCGCGGGTACITKERAGSTGVVLSTGGILLFVGGSILGAQAITRRKQLA